MTDIFGDLTSDLFTLLHTEYNKEENKAKIKTVLGEVLQIIIDKLKNFFIIIVILLFTMSIMNFMQFYYHVKLLKRQMTQ